MAETFTLTTPETKPANPGYQIVSIYEMWFPPGAEQIDIRLRGSNGEMKTVTYGPLGLVGVDGQPVPGTPTGQTLLRAQNRMNFSATSRQKRIYQQLNTDGVLVGAVTGAPD